MNLDGTSQARLTYTNKVGQIISFLPNGTKIIFISEGDIYIMNLDGTNINRLTTNGGINYFSLSPIGTKVVYVDTMGNISIMNIDGSNQMKLSEGYSPSFSPDGTKIVFFQDGIYK